MKPQGLEGFGSLAEFLRERTRARGAKADLAKACGVQAQHVSQWLAGSIPKTRTLQAIAEWARVDYAALRMLADGASMTGTVPKRFYTRTELGAVVGRKFEELYSRDQASALQALGLLETLIAVDRQDYVRAPDATRPVKP